MPKFVDMAKTPAEVKEELSSYSSSAIVGLGNINVYPYGLCISLCQEDLDKLDMEGDMDVGDLIDLRAIGKVTSVNKRDTENGADCRVEIQLTHIAIEDEEDEEEEAPVKYKLGRNRPYK